MSTFVACYTSEQNPCGCNWPFIGQTLEDQTVVCSCPLCEATWNKDDGDGPFVLRDFNDVLKFSR